ncbi:MAG: sigma-70 family RNA polymerase sigma factor [Phycisphaerales bacterium]|nr:sigma-70 family RNA polymerase sigma factor [Phycisphaerales bacterium]MCB9863870.1 sigma-70 family RNA polymerase sigma factor [Phycisphaerales bacterium]
MFDPSGPQSFATTHWSLVLAAGSGESADTRAQSALEELCRTYWYPLYAFARRRGLAANDAQDMTQAFFASIIESNGLSAADPARGRFRSYLLGAMKHFLANEWHRDQAKKRGGGVRIVEWDALDSESRFSSGASSDDPEMAFDREWALEIVAAAMRDLQSEMQRAGKSSQFDVLKGALVGDEGVTRTQMAEQLKTTQDAVKVAVHRLRRRYRALIRSAVAETVGSTSDLDDELRYLVDILRKS